MMPKPTTTLNKDDIMKLIPQQVYTYFSNASPDELEQFIRYGLNVDEQKTLEIITAYSYYQALTDDERATCKKAIAQLSVSHLLSFIEQYNENLINRIEQLFDAGIGVIPWLENQITRLQAMLLVFDELIREGKTKYEPTTKN